MKSNHFIFAFVLLGLVVYIPLSTEAGLVTGPNARAVFENYRTSNLDMFLDFESITPGLYSSLPKIEGNHILLTTKTFQLATKTFRYPLPEKTAPAGTRVAVLPYDFIKSPPNHRLMGVKADNKPDGQSKYEIVFKKCHDRVGLKRMWNTYSVTRFYQQNRLLAQHRNKTNNEFVGYIRHPEIADDACVTRVEFDGYPLKPNDKYNKLYMVGEVDDLFYSAPAVFMTILVNGKDTCVVSAGDEVMVLMSIKNYGSYTITNPTIKVSHLDHKTDKNISVTQHPTIEKNGGVIRKFFYIATTKNTTSGAYRINTSIHSSSGVLILEKTSWYTVSNLGTEMTPALHLLLSE